MSISRATWPRRSRSSSPATIPALVKPRAIALLPAWAAALAAIVTGCGGGDSGSGVVDVGPAAAVPQNAALYLDGTVKPTGSAEAGARSAARKIIGTNDPGSKIVSLIEREAKADGHPIDYQRDVAPWLGEKAGVFFTSLADNAQKGAAVVQTTDVNASLAFARKASGATPTNPAPQSYKGVSVSDRPKPGGQRLRNRRQLPHRGRRRRLQGRGGRVPGRIARRLERLPGCDRKPARRPAGDDLHDPEEPAGRLGSRADRCEQPAATREKRGRFA